MTKQTRISPLNLGATLRYIAVSSALDYESAAHMRRLRLSLQCFVRAATQRTGAIRAHLSGSQQPQS